MTKKGTGGIWILLGLVFGILVAINAEVDYNQEGLDCWDICVFEQADDPKNTNALALLYNIINRIRHLRIFDGVSKIWYRSRYFPKFTDLGSLIGKTHCGNLRIFLSLKIHMKSI